jgi:hypothetical protein
MMPASALVSPVFLVLSTMTGGLALLFSLLRRRRPLISAAA